MEDNSRINISVVVPLYNEEESLAELHEWIVRVMGENGFSYEIVFVDDCSRSEEHTSELQSRETRSYDV